MSALAVSPLVQAEGARVSPRGTVRQICPRAGAARAGATVVPLCPGVQAQPRAAVRPASQQRGRGALSAQPQAGSAPLRLVTPDYVAGVQASQRAGALRLRAQAKTPQAALASVAGAGSGAEVESLHSWLAQVGNVVLVGASMCAGAFMTAAVVAGVLR
ncbi:MAG: hypothetical protein Q3999_04460 [Buchananella hordeovulneris]|nr:hypothetical protein [Buchananella hordeovulneris]